jgi:hypothetical protein
MTIVTLVSATGCGPGSGPRGVGPVGQDSLVGCRAMCSRTRTVQLVLVSLAAACITGISATTALAGGTHAALSDRPIKVCLAERLPRAPQLMVLGSSRAEKVEPSLVQRLTGLSTFNAAVSGGTPDDTWAYANFLHALPGAPAQRVLWFLDVESLERSTPNPGLLATPQLAPYLLSPPQTPPTASRQCSLRTSPGTTYSARGFRAHDFHDAAVERHVSQGRSLALSIAHYRSSYQRFPALIPAAEHRFEQTVSLINSWGVTPVIVLTPVHPLFEKGLTVQWGRMHRQVLAYVAALPDTLEIDFIDASSITTFGGTPRAFYDGVHMKVANMRRLVRYVIRVAHRDLGPAP